MKRAFQLSLMGMVGMAVAVAAQAQVALVYKHDGRDHVISGTESGRLIYRDDGKMMPVTGKGQWEIRAIDSFADPLGSVAVAYAFQPPPFPLESSQLKAGRIQLSFRMEFRPETAVRHLYYVCAWEVEGKLVAVAARSFYDAAAKKTSWIDGQLEIDAADQNGRLRAYLFVDGKSLRGVSNEDIDLVAFRKALDQGAYATAGELLRSLGPGRSLPQSLVEQVARSGDVGLLELALSGSGAKHVKGHDGVALLLAAAQTGRVSCVQLLLQRKVDANASIDGGSALYRATAAQSTGSVEKLLVAGAKPQGDWGVPFNPLRWAIGWGNVEIVRLLLDHGDKVPENWRGDVFRAAAGKGRIELLSLLRQRDSKPDALIHIADSEGEDALMFAASAGQEEAVAWLRKAGVSLTEHDKENRTAAAWALKGNHGDLAVKLLKEMALKGAPASRLLHDALLANNQELVNLSVANDATLDVNASDFETVVETVVRTGNLPVLLRALERSLDVNHKFHHDWNIVGMAERYHRSDVVAALERRAGEPLVRCMPKPEKLQVNVARSGPLLGVRELGKDFHGGTAQVDIYIDAEGVPHLPMLRSATDERLGRAALANVLTWRFDRLAGKTGSWRRIIFPYDLPPPDPTDGVLNTFYFDGELPWVNPETIPSISAVGEEGLKEAGWVRFFVSATGEILKPHVMAVTAPGIEPQVLEVLKSWHFYPGRAGQEDVVCGLECVVILPGKVSIVPNSCVYLGDKAPDDFYTVLPISRDMRSIAQRESGPTSKNSLVLGIFSVDRTGSPGKLKIMGSPGPGVAALAQASYANLTFQPLVINRKETAYRMVMALVVRDVNDR